MHSGRPLSGNVSDSPLSIYTDSLIGFFLYDEVSLQPKKRGFFRQHSLFLRVMGGSCVFRFVMFVPSRYVENFRARIRMCLGGNLNR